MNLSVIAAIAYGILAIVGGIMGYAQAKSKVSLIAGCGCGILLLISAILQTQGQTWGLLLATIITIVLMVAFVMRFIKTRKFMPAGLMLILGVPALGVMVSQLVS
ncbi:MAG: hypothetical protein KME15_17210 [Drouetiella hepatica Uher 2000/2452]|uniref:Small integral membrane protein n=1 Tax=Drouetiella hepatica Uher 2000/2452 TaxID=904376 RepID=A0A951QEG4_9CYAN|nr:hypothetical protein [Drouetiella hepatica Uher 2000/2452]